MRRLVGIHAVEAALRAGTEIERVIVAQGAKNRRLQPLIDDCRKKKVPLRFESTAGISKLAGAGNHQGIMAIVAEADYGSLSELIAKVAERAVIVVLDGVEDPHNLGAIIRTANAAGATAVVIPERRSAGLTETVAKAAAGALEFLPVVRVKNINRAMEELKSAHFWLYGFDEKGIAVHHEIEYDRRCVLVMGGEGSGLHQKTADRCDFLVRIPLEGEVSSLNVSVATGVALFEVARQRQNPIARPITHHKILNA